MKPIEWTGSALPPRIATFQKDFITKYMDPTEVYERIDKIAVDYPEISEMVALPNDTQGYQRQAMAMLAGTTAATPTRRRPPRATPCSCSRRRWATSAATTSRPSSSPDHAGAPLS